MTLAANINRQNVPQHVAIIMDGNGRWAQSQGHDRLIGHHTGVESVREALKAAQEVGVKFLTLYAFSTENWKRPSLEVKGLMSLLDSYLKSEVNTMLKNMLLENTNQILNNKNIVPIKIK